MSFCSVLLTSFQASDRAGLGKIGKGGRRLLELGCLRSTARVCWIRDDGSTHAMWSIIPRVVTDMPKPKTQYGRNRFHEHGSWDTQGFFFLREAGALHAACHEQKLGQASKASLVKAHKAHPWEKHGSPACIDNRTERQWERALRHHKKLPCTSLDCAACMRWKIRLSDGATYM